MLGTQGRQTISYPAIDKKRERERGGGGGREKRQMEKERGERKYLLESPYIHGHDT